jgi:hypothetical protein
MTGRAAGCAGRVVGGVARGVARGGLAVGVVGRAVDRGVPIGRAVDCGGRVGRAVDSPDRPVVVDGSARRMPDSVAGEDSSLSGRSCRVPPADPGWSGRPEGAVPPWGRGRLGSASITRGTAGRVVSCPAFRPGATYPRLGQT